MSDSDRSKFDYVGLLAALAVILPLYVVMIWQMSGEQARHKVEATYAARDYAQSTDAQIRDLCISGSLQARVDCAAKVIAANRESERSERDLEAQQTMARWTFVMGGVAGAGLLISGIGVGLVFITFREARRAADAAHDANRPWLSVEIARFGGLSIDENGVEVAVELKGSNIGRSPATYVKGITMMTVNPESAEEFTVGIGTKAVKDTLINWRVHDRTMGRTVFPNQQFTEAWKSRLSWDEIAAKKQTPEDTEFFFFIAVGVRYRFGQHTGQSCTEYSLVLLDSNDLAISTEVHGHITADAFRLDDTYTGYAT